jgi:hypothetical protein
MSTGQPGPRPFYAINDQPKVDTVKDLQDILDSAMKKAFNPHPMQYRRVTVQFFKFKGGDLDVDRVEEELAEAFRNVYGFTTRYYQIGTIPNLRSELEVQRICGELQMERGGDRCLLILVFSGHGEVEHFAGRRTLWVGYVFHSTDTKITTNVFLSGRLDMFGRIEEPRLNWANATSGLGMEDSDVLQILDCCGAAEVVTTLGPETLAATAGTEAAAADPSVSFTNALKSQLILNNGAPTTIAQLFASLVKNRTVFELEYTPFYCPHSSKHSILLSKVGSGSTVLSKTEKAKADALRIVIKAHLVKSLTPRDIDQFKKWLLTNVPASVTGLEVQVEGYFEAGSGVILLSVPIEVWACLEENPAFGFVAWVQSANLLLGRNVPQQNPLVELPIRGSENTRPGSGAKP